MWRFRLDRVTGGLCFSPLLVGNSFGFWSPHRELLNPDSYRDALCLVVGGALTGMVFPKWLVGLLDIFTMPPTRKFMSKRMALAVVGD
ncbi:hypothetical protein [Nonlabens spongiae]|uniref:hypothetical protein n=1 Tax=Nonlabens spongiae TaxID=331648 RepID=UPI0012F4BC2C|nr:hypothetical protein [Nonlabens spongiae]